MKIENKKELLKLDGEPIKIGAGVLTLGQALSNILLMDEKGGKMKMFILAQKFFSDDATELDKADFNLVKTAVEQTKQYNALVAGQIAVILEGLKEDTEKK